MKILLTAVLIVFFIGCKGKNVVGINAVFPDSSITICNINDCDTIVGKTIPITEVIVDSTETVEWQYKYAIEHGEYYHPPNPSPLPDTTHPLKIKMQPRWRDSSEYWFCGYQPVTIYEVPEKPTHILLVCDTSQANGFRSQRVYWIYGYVIYTNKGDVNMTGDEGITYLDSDGAFLKKNIIVWLSKEIK